MTRTKRICLIVHDNLTYSLLEWAHDDRGTLARHELFATGTTGSSPSGTRSSRIRTTWR